MIKALDRSQHGSRVVAKCDDCGHSEYEACDYERGSNGSWRANEGQVIHRLTKRGWSHIKGRLRCMSCEIKRKSQKGGQIVAENVTPLRQPSREQKRQIIDLLTEVYDTKAERFRGCESDVTVADAIGGGVLFGWVAQIRDELFGPDGRNEELDSLADDIRQWQSTADGLLTKAHAAISDFEAARSKVSEMQGRLDAIVKAAGPRAALRHG